MTSLIFVCLGSIVVGIDIVLYSQKPEWFNIGSCHDPRELAKW